MATKKEKQEFREALKNALRPNLALMSEPLGKLLLEHKNEEGKPFKLTVTLTAPNGVQARICMRECTDVNGHYGVHFCDECID